MLKKILTVATEAAAEVTHDGDDTWQTLSFTFDTALDGKAATTDGVYTNFVIHAYWTAGQTEFSGVTKDERTFYVDNISGPEYVEDLTTDASLQDLTLLHKQGKIR